MKKRDITETLRDKRKAMWEKMNKPENKTEALRARLQREEEQLLFQIDEAAWVIESMSAGKIYSPSGAKAVQRLDALTQAEERLSEAIRCLEQAIEAEGKAGGKLKQLIQKLPYHIIGIAGAVGESRKVPPQVKGTT